jgi:hypothetical protein
VGFAALLSSETPWADRHGDVLSAACAMGAGELIATDIPWLVAGKLGPAGGRPVGPLVAPSLMRHLLATHLARDVPDAVQYWNRWDEEAVILRDLADLERRYPPLRTVRWAGGEHSIEGGSARVVRVGVELPALSGAATARRLLIRTGRIDQRDAHEGLPAEPLAIFMKWLGREARERTEWALKNLRDVSVCWQFDCAVGMRYALHYAAVDGIERATDVLLARGAHDGGGEGQLQVREDNGLSMLQIDCATGIFGDRSLQFQEQLTHALCGWIERQALRPG